MTIQSIPGTRHYFTKILCGYEDENDPYMPLQRNEQEEKTFEPPPKRPYETRRGL
jgi:hypothetical protein